MTVWQVQPWAKRFLRGHTGGARLRQTPAPAALPRGEPAVRPLGERPVPGIRVGPAPGLALRPRGTNIALALGWLLGGYALITALVAWMLSTGHAQDGPIRALAPISLLVSIFVAVGALGMTVFGGRRYRVVAIGTFGIAVGVTVAAAGAMVTATF